MNLSKSRRFDNFIIYIYFVCLFMVMLVTTGLLIVKNNQLLDFAYQNMRIESFRRNVETIVNPTLYQKLYIYFFNHILNEFQGNDKLKKNNNIGKF